MLLSAPTSGWLLLIRFGVLEVLLKSLFSALQELLSFGLLIGGQDVKDLVGDLGLFNRQFRQSLCLLGSDRSHLCLIERAALL